ncbi:hypothetical protein LTR16_006850, partial [Cryomyces antarcticus]
FLPEVAGALGVGAVLIIGILLSLVAGGSTAAPSKQQMKDAAQKAKDAAVDAKDKVAESVSTGVEKTQAEVNRRSTRSTNAQ